VLPHMWCYCDKYWHRLDECAVPNARGAQPLPFLCPMDHVVDPAFWHGDTAARARRAKPGLQPDRADGPPSEGVPFRTRRWLNQLGQHPHVGLASATLASSPVAENLHTADSVALMTAQLQNLTRSGTAAARPPLREAVLARAAYCGARTRNSRRSTVPLPSRSAARKAA